jgi:hypothetical protein
MGGYHITPGSNGYTSDAGSKIKGMPATETKARHTERDELPPRRCMRPETGDGDSNGYGAICTTYALGICGAADDWEDGVCAFAE